MSAKENPAALDKGRPGYHDATVGLGGTPALSPLTLRFRLALWGLVTSLIGVVVFGVVVEQAPIAVAFGVVALTALVDLVVIQRRRHRGEPG